MEGFTRHFILPLARRRGWTSFCEIGASTGLATDEILRLPITSYTIIDPGFDAYLARKYAGDARVIVKKANSLDVLPTIDGTYDCILIDGDHNWFTVFNELRVIRERGLLNHAGMIFFHDVDWPFGRRDMYYQPDTIPQEYRHEYERKGLIRGQSQLADVGGANAKDCNAVHEGGPRNGVLTAIEDFQSTHPSEYSFCRVRLEPGLGILQYRQQTFSKKVAFLLLRIKTWIYSCYSLVLRLKGR